MQTLRYGDRGLFVQYLQGTLLRAGEEPGEIDGIFGRRTETALTRFQDACGIRADGIADRLTWAALWPYFTGATFRIRDTGEPVPAPLGFDVVFTDVPYSAFLTACVLEGLTLRYPFLAKYTIGRSVSGRRIEAIRMGAGPLRVGINAAHHANEWITTPLTLLFLERYAKALSENTSVGGVPARMLYESSTLTLVPLVNPDGVDLVTGALPEGDSFYESARALSAFYPSVPFPSGWKANLAGTDLNLGYPAGWEEARAIKFAQGFTRPGPRDYVGTRPLEAPEDRAMYDLTLGERYDRAIAYHTQGGEIYWEYRGTAPRGSRALAERFAAASGYRVAGVPQSSGNAGYKDWMIDRLHANAFTVEAGRGENPLPIGDLPALYAENEGIFTAVLTP